MEVNELTAVDSNVDFTQILPIQQKRTIAFINNFIMNTVSFLNTFCQSCESRLMEFEYKMQRVEASLLILESQLSSISSLEHTDDTPKTAVNQTENPAEVQLDLPEVVSDDKEEFSAGAVETEVDSGGPKACQDARYIKFFKMVQFGVPPQAVKLKMRAEGVDPDVLDKPNEVIPGFSTSESKLSDDS